MKYLTEVDLCINIVCSIQIFFFLFKIDVKKMVKRGDA